MMSKVILTENKNRNISRLVTAIKQLDEIIETEVKGQFKHSVTIQTGNVKIKNTELDLVFTIPFDDDTEANEAEIIVYNLTNNTINNIKNKEKITITAGYGTDTGIIFSGYISKRKTTNEGCDKVTTINALDSMSLKEKDIQSITYAAGTKASRILKDLCQKVGLPIAVFSVKRDHTYKDEETVDGGLMSNIKRLAEICGVSAYILKSKIYVRPLNQGDNTYFELSSDTGLLSVSEFSEEETHGDFKDTVKGYDIEMLLHHKVQTGSIISLKSKSASGKFRVKSGEHTYNGTEMITKIKVVQS